MGVIRILMLVQNIITSIAMGVYMHRVFFGEFAFFSAVVPETINASYVTWWVSVVGLAYVISQAVSVLFRPPGSVFSVMAAWLFSIWPIAEIAVFSVHRNGSPFQNDAWWTWLLCEVIDIILIGISARLLQRSVYGDVQRIGGHAMI